MLSKHFSVTLSTVSFMKFRWQPKRLCTLLLLFFSLSNYSYSQTFSVSGKVIDSLGVEIPFGNAIIRNIADSSVITGTSFMDGVFSIEGVSEKRFLLEVSSFGFSNFYMLVETDGTANYDAGTIKLVVHDLDEVTISVFRSRIIRSPEKLTVDVEATMLSSSNSILELLSHTPNVLVINGDVTVFGKGAPLFYLDNQRVTLDVLKAVPVSQIKSVEVITNPSARYEAGASAVIRLVTKEFNNEGFQVNLKQNVRKGFGVLSFSEAGINYRTGKFSMLANYNLELGTTKKIDDYTRTASYNNGLFDSRAKTTSDITHRNKSSYLVGFDYDLTKKSTISLQYNGRYEDSEFSLETNNDVSLPGGNAYKLLSVADIAPNNFLLNRYSLNYELKLDTLGSNLLVGAQYSNQKSTYLNVLKESFEQGGGSVPLWQKQIDYTGDVDIFTGNADYELKTAKRGSFRIGGKFSSVGNENRSDFALRENDNSNWTSYPDFVSKITYDEQIAAGYVEYDRTIKKVHINAGVRSEYTDAHVQNGNGVVLFDTTYLNFFPSLSISRGNLTLNYSRKINRVPFDYLNAVNVYVDSFSVSQGNPLLQPTFYNSVDLNFANLVNVGYAKVKNEVQQFFIQDSLGNRTLITFDNVRSMDRFTASLTIPVPSKKFVSYLVSGCNYLISQDSRFKDSGVKAKPQFYVYAYGAFNVGKLFKLQLIGQYVSASSNGISTLKSFGNVDVSVSRDFLKEKLSVELYGGDLFRTTIYNGTQYSQTAQAGFKVVSDTRFVRLALKYNFGRLKNVTYKVNELGKEETDRAKKGN
ncbi:MAG TPA: outer membrane beta-barrel family protein [Fluviicola sp.]|nr:outer membrane beta-barrel family protein [Fluviicola sp.]